MDNEKTLQQLSLAVSYIVQNMDGFSDDQAMQVADLYPAWHIGVSYRVGQIVKRSGQLYRCVQANDSQEGWEPEAAAALWSAVSFSGDVENWKRPTGGHDCYNIGDHVMHNGSEWVSLVNGNNWEPSADVPTIWQLV